MERKNYLEEGLSKEEKSYLKRIVKTARNKYFEKNHNYMNNVKVTENLTDGEESDVIEEVFNKYVKEINSAIEFERIFLNPKLFYVIKALSLKEKKVLFYLYKEQKTINEISKIMKIDRVTVYRIRNRAHAKIAENLIKGEC